MRPGRHAGRPLRIDRGQPAAARLEGGRYLLFTVHLDDVARLHVLEAFEPDGEELMPAFALRQAERALRKDPGSAESHHDLGLAHRRLGHLARAREEFARAAMLDVHNPWPWFDRGPFATNRALD